MLSGYSNRLEIPVDRLTVDRVLDFHWIFKSNTYTYSSKFHLISPVEYTDSSRGRVTQPLLEIVLYSASVPGVPAAAQNFDHNYYGA